MEHITQHDVGLSCPQKKAINRSNQGVNQVTIDGILSNIGLRRFSPAGVPITKLVLMHQSKQPEGDCFKKVQCQISVQLTGEIHDPVLSQLQPGDCVLVRGYLIRNAYREDQSWVKLQALDIEKLLPQSESL